MKRKVIEINEERCNGCGLCATACHENAIEIINGKAKLVSDQYCDGLGNCLPACPMDAIRLIDKETVPYDEAAVQQRIVKKEEKAKLPCGCPGTMAKRLSQSEQGVNNKAEVKEAPSEKKNVVSQLRQWPVQLNLVNAKADYFNGADLLIAADCTAYAYANFHEDFIKDHITVIGCPKLDDNQHYQEKLAEILAGNNIHSITVVRMEVPCCGGIVSAVKGAMLKAQVIVPYKEITIGLDGHFK